VNRWLSRLTSLLRKPVNRVVLVEDSPLRCLDPRAKLAMSLSASTVVMLPVDRLAIFLALYVILLIWARLLPTITRQVWRLRWVLLFLFILDWWMIDLSLAVHICLRLVLLTVTFSLLFATTTFSEFRLAIERLGLPYRFAFSLSLAFQSLGLLQEEWQAIREAQQARGIVLVRKGLRETIRHVGTWVGLVIPAIVLTTRRAWALTESAYARGFDSPKRKAYNQLILRAVDWLVVGIALVVPVIFYWRW
jgi:energy-coupling factor transport system permease protein